MVRRLSRGLVGRLASRKARKLEQVGVSGDGGISEPVDETLKAIAAANLHASVWGKA
jgi:hypothetical protein